MEETERRMTGLEIELKEAVAAIADVQTVLMGPLPMRSNGIRGDMKLLAKELAQAVEWGKDIWNTKRREECLGKEETCKIWIWIKEHDEREDKMATSKMSLRGIYVMSVLQFAGMILVAMIAAGVFK